MKDIWQISENKLVKTFHTKNFAAGITFINKISRIAEELNHHPDIHLTNYKNLRIELYTHSAQAITELDYKLAGLIDKLAEP